MLNKQPKHFLAAIHAKLQRDSMGLRDEGQTEQDMLNFLRDKLEINADVENMEWQRTALKIKSLRKLYTAKC